jgi:glycosyltransferase involved in cell wall biosynthesis
MDPLVSVVTPIFNTEPYLAECVESVLAQSYRHLEYILLDNKSTDRSAAIAAEYARKDPRIRFVQADVHLPQESNYNRAIGLIAPSSRYCKVVQADDWLFPECLERMVAVAESAPTVGLVGCYLMRGAHIGCQGLDYTGSVFPGRVPCRLHLLEGRSVFGSPTAVLYRSDEVRARSPFYPESSLLADTEVCYDILRTRDFGFVHQVLAYARDQEGAITSGIERYHPYLLHELILLRKHGPAYLTVAELEDRWATLSRVYCRFLGGQVLRRASPAFWAYHRSGWEAMGYRMSGARLAACAFRAFTDLALNPKATLERVLDHRPA